MNECSGQVFKRIIISIQYSTTSFKFLSLFLSPNQPILTLTMPTIAIICTSATKMGDHDTGAWLEEAAVPYLMCKEKGMDVDMISINGGEIPWDQGSMQGDFMTAECTKFMADEAGQAQAKNSKKLTEVDILGYDGIYLAGGHGTCADFYGNQDLYDAVDKAYAAGKVVAADCHGPIGLLGAKKPDGTPLVAGLKVTGFTDVEESQVGLTEKVPALIETEFRKLGADFQAGPAWGPNVAIAGKLITGQNPQSSTACAKAFIEAL